MNKLSFNEFQTPILTSSSPEGARDFLVPSRSTRKIYALPQAPQQFKQLIMVSGLTNIFKLHLVLEMKMLEQTEVQENFIN